MLLIIFALLLGWRSLPGGGSVAACTGALQVSERRTDALADGTQLQRGDADTTLMGFELTNECADASMRSVTVVASTTAMSRTFTALRLYGDGVELGTVQIPYPTTTPLTFTFANPLFVQHGAKKSLQLRGDVSTSTESISIQLLLTDIAIEQAGTTTAAVFRAENGAQLSSVNPERSATFR